MALSLCGVPLELLRVGAMRHVTLAASVVLLTCLILIENEEAPAWCEGALATAVTI